MFDIDGGASIGYIRISTLCTDDFWPLVEPHGAATIAVFANQGGMRA
ncbi:hypothetical protein [Pseudoxanthomonas wuyuanensis]|uniref:Uncharacterized protein n=1 Tax=Pseudoxanthomonas wuyuanensis TaxID=1073196 RepID=A0A286D7A9_9GAMM|nr:hypothetical protein [Pseudoxanthomonas wuyuanensis]SOD54528.1 hypothetical protein SAMN06296416_104135 [Pseudoxanthomonas wuyuanensis]